MLSEFDRFLISGNHMLVRALECSKRKAFAIQIKNKISILLPELRPAVAEVAGEMPLLQ